MKIISLISSLKEDELNYFGCYCIFNSLKPHFIENIEIFSGEENIERWFVQEYIFFFISKMFL